MKHEVSNQETLSKCKELLDVWSASRPYTPTTQLGSDTELVGAISHTVERFTLTTAYRVRWAEWRQMPKGADYSSSPCPASAYDLWNDIHKSVKDQEFEYGIDDTSKKIDCPNSECHDGQVECDSCHGKGEGKCSKCSGSRGYAGHQKLADLKDGGYVACSRCHRSGWLSDGHGGHQPCPDCNPGGYGSPRDGDWVDKGRGRHPGWIVCEKCHGTGIATCTKCNGVGHVDCPTCEGQGYVVRKLFVVQKCATDTQRKLWLPNCELTEEFYSVGKLEWSELYADGEVDGKLRIGLSNGASDNAKAVAYEDGLEGVWAGFDDSLDNSIARFRTANNDAQHKISEQSACLEQYDGIIEYNYKFDGKNYTAWINLATGAVEECENGLYASIAEETVKLAQESEKKGIPQDAIYYYCKADAISPKWGKENGTQKNRVKQYRVLGAFFGGSMFLVSIVTWLPALICGDMNFIGIVSSLLGLAVMTACLVSLNEVIQLLGIALAFGLSWFAREQFGVDFVNDLVAREGYLISLLFYAWTVVTLTTDQAQRLPGGRIGLIAGGLLAGLCASPLAMYTANVTQTFVSVGGMFIPLVALVVFSLVRLPVRLKAGKMQRFVEKNDGNGEEIRNVIEGRKPCFSGVIHGAIVVGCILTLSLLGTTLGGLFDLIAGDIHFSIITTLQEFGIL